MVKDDSLYVIAIVAVVAVVGLVIMATGSTVVAEDLPSMVDSDDTAIAGQAIQTMGGPPLATSKQMLVTKSDAEILTTFTLSSSAKETDCHDIQWDAMMAKADCLTKANTALSIGGSDDYEAMCASCENAFDTIAKASDEGCGIHISTLEGDLLNDIDDLCHALEVEETGEAAIVLGESW